MVEGRKLLAQFWALISRHRNPGSPSRGSEDRGNARTTREILEDIEAEIPEINLEGLLDEVSGLIAKNQIGQLKTQKDIRKLNLIVEDEIEQLEEMKHVIARKMALRRINGRRKRLNRLEKIVSIYHDNIDLHFTLSDRLEEARISGIKTITTDQLNELTLDYQEKAQEHDEIVKSARDLLSTSSEPDEPELRELAKEFGIEIGV